MLITETDTKNKRGRPGKWPAEYYLVWNNKEKRPAQNLYYAAMIIHLMGQEPGDFFITEKGNYRRQGIAEKIGRLYCAGKLTEEQAVELTNLAIEHYKTGATVKQVEQAIKTFSESYIADM